MEYYSYGNRDKVLLLSERKGKSFRAVKDNSSNILERNFLSVNKKESLDIKNLDTPKPEYKKLQEVSQLNRPNNYYLDLKSQYNNKEKYNISPLLCNSGEYSIQKKKLYALGEEKLKLSEISNCVSNEEFNSKKENLKKISYSPVLLSKSNSISKSNYQNFIENQQLFFDRNNKHFRKNKPNFRSFDNEKDILTKNNQSSKESPEWFKFCSDAKLKDIESHYVNNGQSLHILSKFQNWITITPRGKNRKRPLENEKLTSLENSKIIPYWMNIKPEVLAPNLFKPVQIKQIRDSTKQTILVDQDQRNAKKFNINSFHD